MVPIRVTGTRNVFLLKCRHSMLSMIRYYQVRCCSWTRRSCWMSSLFIQCCFQWFGLTAVVVVHWSCEGFFLAKINIFYTSRYVPGFDSVMDDYLLLDGTAPNRSIHAPKSAGNTFMHAACVFFFLSHPRVISAHDVVKLPPFRNSYPGSHDTHSSPFPTTVLAFVVLVANNERLRVRFPSPASPCVELVCIHATYLYNTQHAGCEALSAVSLYIDAFVSGFDLDPNEHIRHFFL